MPRRLIRIVDGSRRRLAAATDHTRTVRTVETTLAALDDTAFAAETGRIRTEYTAAPDRPDTLAAAAAAIADTVRRRYGHRLHDNQLVAAHALGDRHIVELATGEGKTLAVAAAACLAATAGRHVHVVTVNDYLAGRDARWMQPVYDTFDVTVDVLDPAEPAERRRQALQADVVYGTAGAFAAEWLRDHLAHHPDQRPDVRRDVVIVDEADSVLLDQARTPVTITAAVATDLDRQHTWWTLATTMEQADEDGNGGHFAVDPKIRAAVLTDAGADLAEHTLGIGDLYDGDHDDDLAGLTNALAARALWHRDIDYLVVDGRVSVIDPTTGRASGRRFTGGLQAALEVKEGVPVTATGRTVASVTLESYFSAYRQLSGTTATAVSCVDELAGIYHLDVLEVASNRPRIRIDHPDVIVATRGEKLDAVVADTAARHRTGQPVLIGALSVADADDLSARFTAAGIPHRMLTARHHHEEAAVIAQAGTYGAVTVATRMAGRGVDIVLGGDEHDQHDRVAATGGLAVILAGRFDNRRSDDQLRGRSGRQGDPGESRCYLSLEDDLIRVYAGDMVAKLVDRLNRADGERSGHRQLTRIVDRAQTAVAGQQYEQRRNLIRYDRVLAVQRDDLYRHRTALLTGDPDRLADTLTRFGTTADRADTAERLAETVRTGAGHHPVLAAVTATIDRHWAAHLADAEQLRAGIGLRRIGAKNPVAEYETELGQLMQQRRVLLADDALTAADTALTATAATADLTDSDADTGGGAGVGATGSGTAAG